MIERRSIGSRIISALLVVCMLVGMLPATALPVFAAETSTAVEKTKDNVDKIQDYAEALLSSNFEKASSENPDSPADHFTWDTEGDKKTNWRYYNGVMFDALLMLGVDSDKGNALEFAKNFLDTNVTNGTITYYIDGELDSVPPALTLLTILDTVVVDEATRASYEKAIHWVYSELADQTSYEQCGGNLLHKQDSNGQPFNGWDVWNIALDGLYMAEPFLVEYANALASGKIDNPNNVDPAKIYEEVYNRFVWVADYVYDTETGLYHHVWDAARSKGNGAFWGRAIGWYAVALVEVIDRMPTGTYKQGLIAKLPKLFDGMIQYQDSSTGMWRNVVNNSNDTIAYNGKDRSNQLETSVTSLMSYALLKAYNEGWTGESKYGTAGLRAFNGIVANKLSDDGTSISGTYLKSGASSAQGYYCVNAYEPDESKGVGAVLMAASEANQAAVKLNGGSATAETFVGNVTAPEMAIASGATTLTSTAGIKATVIGDQGTIKNISGSELTYEIGTVSNGKATVTAKYNGVSIDTFEVNVNESGSSSDAETHTVTYTYEDFVASITYSDEISIPLSEGGRDAYKFFTFTFTDGNGETRDTWSNTYSFDIQDTSVVAVSPHNPQYLDMKSVGSTIITFTVDSFWFWQPSGNTEVRPGESMTFDIKVNVTSDDMGAEQEPVPETVTHSVTGVAVTPGTIEVGDTVTLVGFGAASDGTDHTYTYNYSITSGGEYASINGNTLSANAAGTVSVTAYLASVDGASVWDGVGKTVTLTIGAATEEDTTLTYTVKNEAGAALAGQSVTLEEGETFTPNFTVLQGITDVTGAYSVSLSENSDAISIENGTITANKVTEDTDVTVTATFTSKVSRAASDTATFTVTVKSAATNESLWVHNFTDDGFTNNGFYEFAGNQLTDGKHGKYTYGSETLNDALKLDSGGSVVFTAPYDGTVTIVVATNTAENRTVTITDSNDTSQGTVTLSSANTAYTLTVDVEAGVEYTVERGKGESGLYYIAYAKTVSCDHSYSSTVTTAATCTTAGVLTYTCSGCGASHTESIPAIGHNYTSSVTTAATCTTAGVKTYTCANDGSHTYTEDIAATGHSYVDGKCSACGAADPNAGGTGEDTDNESLWVHNFTDNGSADNGFYDFEGSTSTSKGSVSYAGLTMGTCLKMDSSASVALTAPADGTLTLVFNTSCAGHTIYINGGNSTAIPANGIVTLEVSENTKYTITKNQSESFLYYIAYTPDSSHTHSYTSSVTTAATCTAAGVRTYTCSGCGASHTESIPAIGHNYTSSVTTAATCTTAGVKTYTCANDGSHTYTEDIAATGHNYVDGVCSNCGKAEKWTVDCSEKYRKNHSDPYTITTTAQSWTFDVEKSSTAGDIWDSALVVVDLGNSEAVLRMDSWAWTGETNLPYAAEKGSWPDGWDGNGTVTVTAQQVGSNVVVGVSLNGLTNVYILPMDGTSATPTLAFSGEECVLTNLNKAPSSSVAIENAVEAAASSVTGTPVSFTANTTWKEGETEKSENRDYQVTVTGYPGSMTMSAGDTALAYALVDDANYYVNYYTIEYSSGNKDIATVDPTTGVVTAVGAGTTNIIATVTLNEADGKTVEGASPATVSIPVTVEAVQTEAITVPDQIVDKNATVTPTPEVTYNGATVEAGNYTVTYEIVSGGEYLSTDGSTLTGLKPGVATVKATVNTVGENNVSSENISTVFTARVFPIWENYATENVSAKVGQKIYFVFSGTRNVADTFFMDTIQLFNEAGTRLFYDDFSSELAGWTIELLNARVRNGSHFSLTVDGVSKTPYLNYAVVISNEAGDQVMSATSPGFIVTEDGTYHYTYDMLMSTDQDILGTLSGKAVVVSPVSIALVDKAITVSRDDVTQQEYNGVLTDYLDAKDIDTFLENNQLLVTYSDGSTAIISGAEAKEMGTLGTDDAGRTKVDANGDRYFDVIWNVGDYSLGTFGYVQYSSSSAYIHNVNVDGKESDFYTINESNDGLADKYLDEKEYSYDGEYTEAATLLDAIKMEKNTTISFTANAGSGKLIIVAASTYESGSTLYVSDGTNSVENDITSAITATEFIYDVEDGKTYTFSRGGSSEFGILYIAYIPEVSKIEIETPSVLTVDSQTEGSVQLDYTTVYKNVELAKVNHTLAWSSSDPDVAVVDDNGVVTAVSEGNATITATLVTAGTETVTETVTGSVEVTVVNSEITGYLNSYDYIVQLNATEEQLRQALDHMILTINWKDGQKTTSQYTDGVTPDEHGGVLHIELEDNLTGTLGVHYADVTYTDATGEVVFKDTIWIHVEDYDPGHFDGTVITEHWVSYTLATNGIEVNQEYVIVANGAAIALKNPSAASDECSAAENATVTSRDNFNTILLADGDAQLSAWLIDTPVAAGPEGFTQYNASNFLRYLGIDAQEMLIHHNVEHVYIKHEGNGVYQIVLSLDENGDPEYYLTYNGSAWKATTTPSTVRMYAKHVEYQDYGVDFSVDPEQIDMPEGREKTISTTVYFNDVDLLSPNLYKVIWSSDDPSVASVDENGVVTSNGQGNANITARLVTVDGYEVVCNEHNVPYIERIIPVTVSSATATPVLTPEKLTIGVGTAPNLNKVNVVMTYTGLSAEAQKEYNYNVERPLLAFNLVDATGTITNEDGKTESVTGFTNAYVGRFTVPVTYDGRQTFNLEIEIVEDPYAGRDTAESIPGYPDAGAVRMSKTAAGVLDFTKTGVVQLELTAAGISTSSPVDVVLIVDVSNSMAWSMDWFDYDKHGNDEAFLTYWEAYQQANDDVTDDDKETAWADFVAGKTVEYQDDEGDTVKVLGAGDVQKIPYTDSYDYENTKLYAAMESAKLFANTLLNAQSSDNTLTFVTFAGQNKAESNYIDSVLTPFVGVTEAEDAVEVFADTYFEAEVTTNDRGNKAVTYTLKIGGEGGVNRGNTNYDFAFGEAADAVEALKKQWSEAHENKDYDTESGRQVHVVFMTDGAPSHYNGHAANVPSSITDQLWDGNGEYSLGKYTSLDGYPFNGTENNATNWLTFIKHYNELADTLYNQVDAMYAVGFDLAHGGFSTFNWHEDEMERVLSGLVKNTVVPVTMASETEQLKAFYKNLAESLVYAANNAKVTDRIGDDFSLFTGTHMYDSNITSSKGDSEDKQMTDEIFQQMKQMPFNVEIKTYSLVLESDIGKTGQNLIDEQGNELNNVTIERKHLGLRYNEAPETIETIRFEYDETKKELEAYSDVIGNENILKTNVKMKSLVPDENGDYVEVTYETVIDAKYFTYGARTVSKTVDGQTVNVTEEDIAWKIGDITEKEIVMSYYAYLEGALDNPKVAQDGIYQTNEFAYLEYVDQNGDYVKRDYAIPQAAWGKAGITYRFYMVNEKGEFVNRANVTFTNPANRIFLDGRVSYTTELNNGGGFEKSALDALDEAGLGEYVLYDAGLVTTVTTNASNPTNEDNGVDLYNTTKTNIKELVFVNDVMKDGSYVNTIIDIPVIMTDKGKSLRPLASATVVMDYGKPMDINVFSADEFDYVGGYPNVRNPDMDGKKYWYTMEIVGFAPYSSQFDQRGYVAATAYTETLSTANGSYSVTSANGDTQVCFTPSRMLSEVETVFVVVKFQEYDYTNNTVGSKTDQFYYMYKQLNIVPATLMYYETDGNMVGAFTYSDTGWQPKSDSANTTESQNVYVPGDIYGYDSSYDKDTTLSNDSAYYAEGYNAEGAKPAGTVTVNFSFTGTGFDIISRTDPAQGQILVRVYSDAAKTQLKKTILVLNKGELNLYQIPVVSATMDAWGTYYVEVGVYNDNNSYTGKFEYLNRGNQFYFDAIRIYNPVVGTETYTEAAMSNGNYTVVSHTVNELYLADKEYKPQISEVRDLLINAQDFNNQTDGVGVIFQDHKKADTSSVDDYKNLGANNEVYLKPGQQIAFAVSSTTVPAKIHIGAKAVNGNAVALKTIIRNTKSGTPYSNEVTTTIASGNDMYYDVMKNADETLAQLFGENGKVYVIITNTGDGILSITDVKVAYDTEPTAMLTFSWNRNLARVAAMYLPGNEVAQLQKSEDGNWYYCVNDAIDTGYIGLAENKYGTWYVQNGQIDFGYTGLAEDNGETYYIYKGAVSTSTNGLMKVDGQWLCFESGRLNTGLVGLVENRYGTWYVADGAIDFTKTGLVEVEGGMAYVRNGQLCESYVGLLKSPDGKWLYIDSGMVDYSYTGIAKNSSGWWYVVEGEIDFTYIGTIETESGTYNVRKGLVDVANPVNA